MQPPAVWRSFASAEALIEAVDVAEARPPLAVVSTRDPSIALADFSSLHDIHNSFSQALHLA